MKYLVKNLVKSLVKSFGARKPCQVQSLPLGLPWLQGAPLGAQGACIRVSGLGFGCLDWYSGVWTGIWVSGLLLGACLLDFGCLPAIVGLPASGWMLAC